MIPLRPPGLARRCWCVPQTAQRRWAAQPTCPPRPARSCPVRCRYLGRRVRCRLLRSAQCHPRHQRKIRCRSRWVRRPRPGSLTSTGGCDARAVGWVATHGGTTRSSAGQRRTVRSRHGAGANGAGGSQVSRAAPGGPVSRSRRDRRAVCAGHREPRRLGNANGPAKRRKPGKPRKPRNPALRHGQTSHPRVARLVRGAPGRWWTSGRAVRRSSFGIGPETRSSWC